MDYQAIMLELSKIIIPEIGYEEYLKIKHEWFHSNKWPTKEEIANVICIGSHWGAVLRITYLNTVWRRKYPPHQFWNAVVKVFILGGLWVPEFKRLLETKEAKQLIQKTTHPDWVPIGLMGCSWKKLKSMCEKFCQTRTTACERMTGVERC